MTSSNSLQRSLASKHSLFPDWYDADRGMEHHTMNNGHFQFIAIPKTGSLTCYTVFESVGLASLYPIPRHEGVQYKQYYFDDKSLPVYAVVRNPFHQIVSFYLYINKRRFDDWKGCEWVAPAQDASTLVAHFINICKNGQFLKSPFVHQLRYLQIVEDEDEKKENEVTVNFFRLEDGLDKFFEMLTTRHSIDFCYKGECVNTTADLRQESGLETWMFYRDMQVVRLVQTEFAPEFEHFGYDKESPKQNRHGNTLGNAHGNTLGNAHGNTIVHFNRYFK
jgi:hypothetical protein